MMRELVDGEPVMLQTLNMTKQQQGYTMKIYKIWTNSFNRLRRHYCVEVTKYGEEVEWLEFDLKKDALKHIKAGPIMYVTDDEIPDEEYQEQLRKRLNDKGRVARGTKRKNIT